METPDYTYYKDQGYLICKNIIPITLLDKIKSNMLNLMLKYVQMLDSELETPNKLDIAFTKVTNLSHELRGNIFKTFGKMSELTSVLYLPKIQKKLEELGFKSVTIQAFSILCVEPFTEDYMFNIHQDLRDRMSLNSVGLWTPLTLGDNIGGIGILPESHKNGPQKHIVSAQGDIQLEECGFETQDGISFTNWDLGDCLLFNPFSYHWSIANRGLVNRWNFVIKIDDILTMEHLKKSIMPFNQDEFIDSRSNEERHENKY